MCAYVNGRLDANGGQIKRQNPSSLHIVYLWHDAGRVRTCPSGYEPDHGDAGLCRKKTAEFAREVTQGTLYAVKSDDRVWCHFRRSRPLQPEGRGG